MRLGKVYYNLEDSNYKFSYKRFNFIFSSKFYIEKFKRELKDYISIEEAKISSKYGKLEASEYLALSLYKKIEKRGFLVYFNDEKIKENETFSVSLSFLKYE